MILLQLLEQEQFLLVESYELLGVDKLCLEGVPLGQAHSYQHY